MNAKSRVQRVSPLCPRCRQPLRQSCDMWGPFYCCERCGFAVEEVTAEAPEPATIDPRVNNPSRGRITPKIAA